MKPDRLLDLFCELARIESPSRREAVMAKRCKAELEDLGFTVRFDDSAERTGSDTGNLIAFRAGIVPGAVALCGHMDTVRPCKGIEPVVEGGVIRSAGDTILSADDKAGVAAIFEGVRSLIEAGEALPDVHVVLTTCEEMHLLGAGALDASFLPEGTPCYVLDADGDPGTIINQAPCHCTFTATFRGKSAHAGVEPERGVSALAMAAQAVCHMPLGRISAHTTSNVGVIECDGATNVVPGTCWLSGECRSTSLERARAERSAMDEAMRAAAAQAGGSVDIEWRTDYLPISYASDHPLVEGVMRAARTAGLRPRLAASGGGADANISAGARSLGDHACHGYGQLPFLRRIHHRRQLERLRASSRAARARGSQIADRPCRERFRRRGRAQGDAAGVRETSISRPLQGLGLACSDWQNRLAHRFATFATTFREIVCKTCITDH